MSETIQAVHRTVLGKKVKRLREEGVLPGNIYGRGLPSIAIQIDSRDFRKVVLSVGIRSMFQLLLEGESDPRHVLVRQLARSGGTGDPIHVDFYQVDLDRPIQTTVSINLVGIAPAVSDLAGTLLQHLETVQVRCLPLNIPSSFEVDVSSLKTFEDSIKITDVDFPEGVEILISEDMSIAGVQPPRVLEETGAELVEGVESTEEDDSISTTATESSEES
jgi:large subunit ribosomal protein L25